MNIKDLYVVLSSILLSTLTLAYIDISLTFTSTALTNLPFVTSVIYPTILLTLTFVFIKLLKGAFNESLSLSAIDYLFSFTGSLPIIVLWLFSSLPLGDDSRYLASALIIPNGFINLPSRAIIVLSKILGVSIICVYWLTAVTIIYLLMLTLLNLLRNFISHENKALLYMMTFTMFFFPSLLSPYFLQQLLTEPHTVNKLIFNTLRISHLGRMISIDPNLLKNIAFLLPLLSLFIKHRNLKTSLLTSYIYTLSLLSHQLDAIVSIIFVELLKIVRGYHLNLKTESFFTFALTLWYLITGAFIGFSQIAFLWRRTFSVEHQIIINCILLLAIVLLPRLFIPISKILSFNDYKVKRSLKAKIVNHKIAFELIIFISVVLCILNPLPVYNYQVLLLYGYYLVPLCSILLISHTHNTVSAVRVAKIKQLIFIPCLLLIFQISTTYVISNYLNYVFPNMPSFIIRYVSLSIRIVMTPPFLISMILPLAVFLLEIRTSAKNLLRKALTMLLCIFSIFNMFFYVTYWGYYYRNPWANSGYPAPISNIVIESISSINLTQPTPWIHTIATDRAIMVRDILGLTAGVFMLNPTTGEDENIPVYVRRTLSYVPDIVIVEERYDFLGKEFKPLKQINITSSVVNVYLISEPKNVTVTKVALIAPLAHPSLAPEYYLSLLKLQKELSNKKILILNADEIKNSGATLMGKIEYEDPILFDPSTGMNVSKVALEGYRFIILKSNIQTTTPPISCGGKTISERLITVYPAYIDKPSEFLISITRLQSICKNGIIHFPEAERVMLIKDYYFVKINQTSQNTILT